MVLKLPHPTQGDHGVPGSPVRLYEHSEPRRGTPPASGADYAPAGSGR